MDNNILLTIKIIIDFVLKLLSYFKSSEDTENDETLKN